MLCVRRGPRECFVVACVCSFCSSCRFCCFYGTCGAVSRRDAAPRAPFRVSKTFTRNRPIARRTTSFARRTTSFARRIHVGTLPVPPAPQNPPFPSPPAPPATTCVLAGLLLAFVPPVGAPGSHGHYHGQGCRWPGFLQHYLTNTPQDTRQQPPRALCSTGKLIRG